ncbi:MAG: CAP domain-containing protein [Bacteriovoracaceae bacterium]
MKKFFSFILLIVLMSCNKSATTSEKSLNAESQTVISEFMALVNNHRKSIGLRSMTHVDQMALLAQSHSDDMAAGTVPFGHDGFSTRCADARTAMNGGNLCAENVAEGQKTAQAVFNSWMNSPTHRANIESARITHCGLGFALSSSGSLYWTNLFLEI